MTADTQTQDTMPLELLRLTPEWKKATERQQLMVESYIASGGDKVFAVMSAYRVKDRETARKMQYDSFSRPAVVAILNLYHRVTPRDAFLRDVERAVRNRKLTVAQIRALELQARLNGWERPEGLPHSNGYVSSEPDESDSAATENTAPRFKAGDIAVREGKKFLVTKVREDGTVSEADPL